MSLPKSTHTSRPWRIHELVQDFRLEDVWALPTPGGPDDFPLFVEGIASSDPTQTSSRAANLLFAVRGKLGEVFGWDEAPGSSAPTLRDRLPADLRETPPGPGLGDLPFDPLYLLEDEWAGEIINKTVHGVIHFGWAPDEAGRYRGEMAIYVKPNGLFGNAYMAAIKPFRYLIVYPALMKRIEREWRSRVPA